MEEIGRTYLKVVVNICKNTAKKLFIILKEITYQLHSYEKYTRHIYVFCGLSGGIWSLLDKMYAKSMSDISEN